MDTLQKVLETFQASSEPLNAGKVAELSGLDRKEVDKAMAKLKAEGKIEYGYDPTWQAVKKDGDGTILRLGAGRSSKTPRGSPFGRTRRVFCGNTRKGGALRRKSRGGVVGFGFWWGRKS